MIKVKRVYHEPLEEDGLRILVDRLWPRGISKKDAKVDLWINEVAPSTDLRKWFNHEDPKWQEFRKKYFLELKERKEEIKQLIELKGEEDITLLFSAKNEEHNNAVALKEYLEEVG